MLWFIFTAIAILLFLIVKFSEKALNFVVPTICISAILMVVGVCGAILFLGQRFIGSKSDYILYSEQRAALVSDNQELVVKASDVGDFNVSLAKYKLHSNTVIFKLMWYYNPDVLTIEPISNENPYSKANKGK